MIIGTLIIQPGIASIIRKKFMLIQLCSLTEIMDLFFAGRGWQHPIPVKAFKQSCVCHKMDVGIQVIVAGFVRNHKVIREDRVENVSGTMDNVLYLFDR